MGEEEMDWKIKKGKLVFDRSLEKMEKEVVERGNLKKGDDLRLKDLGSKCVIEEDVERGGRIVRDEIGGIVEKINGGELKIDGMEIWSELIEGGVKKDVKKSEDEKERILRKMRIGGMEMKEMKGNSEGERKEKKDIDNVEKRVRVGWLKEDRWIKDLEELFWKLEKFKSEVEGRELIIEGDEKGNDEIDVEMILDVEGKRGKEKGDEEFNVKREKEINKEVIDLWGKGRVIKVILIEGRKEIGVEWENKMWKIEGFEGIEILNIGSVVIDEKGEVWWKENEIKNFLKWSKRKKLGGCEGWEEDEGGKIIEGIER